MTAKNARRANLAEKKEPKTRLILMWKGNCMELESLI